MVSRGRRVVLRLVVPTLRLALQTAFGDGLPLALHSELLSLNLPRDAAEAAADTSLWEHPRAGPEKCRRSNADGEVGPPAVPTRCLLGELSAKSSACGSDRGRRAGHLPIHNTLESGLQLEPYDTFHKHSNPVPCGSHVVHGNNPAKYRR